MTVFVAIPVKSLTKSKERLSSILTLEERQTLTLTMLEDILKMVKGSSIPKEIVILSSDLKIKEFAKGFNIECLAEKSQGLNHAVEQAAQLALQRYAESFLFLSADTPLITSDDVNQIIKLGSEKNCLVIVPSLTDGTNALLQKPPNLIKPCFGPESFKKHLAQASKKGMNVKIYTSETLSMDIDSPEDLKHLLKTGEHTGSHRFLKKIGLDNRLIKLKK